MNIKNKGLTKVVASLILISTLVSGVASAAQGDKNIQKETAFEPFIFAAQYTNTAQQDTNATAIVNDTFIVAQQIPAHPKSIVSGSLIVKREMFVDSTGYNSEEKQTDASPFITANGEHVYYGGVAANFLPFGTKIKIPDYYGDQVFRVNDRMNKRYDKRVDIWFAEKPTALKWGVRHNVRIQILEES